MIMSFDKFERFEQPQLILCSPGSQYINGDITLTVGELSYITDLEIQYNFGAPSEMNFRLNCLRQETDENDKFILDLYERTANRMNIFLPDIGYFQITNTVSNSNGKFEYKDVTAKSCDYELARKNIPYVPDGLYSLSGGSDVATDLLALLLSVVPAWSVDYIDPDLSTLYRSFKDVNTDMDVLSFLTDEIQKAFECIVVFDAVNRHISLYAKTNYHNHTEVHLSTDDLVNEIAITEDADNLFTALRVAPDDNISLSMVNPLGGNVVYNFSHYIPWMSNSLREKMAEWQNNIQGAADTYQGVCYDYYMKLDEQSDMLAESQRLDILLDVYQTCKNNFEEGLDDIPIELYNSEIIAAGGEVITVYDDISQTISAITVQLTNTKDQKDLVDASLQTIADDLFALESEMSAIRNQVSFKSFLTQEEYDELSSYVFEGNYKDEYITITDTMTSSDVVEQKVALYNRVVDKLSDVAVPTREFSINTVDFVFSKAFSEWTDQLFTGCLINVELSKNEVAELFLTSIAVNYEERSAELSFGSRVYRNDAKALFDEVLGEISVAANTVL